MLVDDMLFEQEWFSELPLRLRFLYIYLLTKCTKTGIFEVNLRKMTYDLNDGSQVTRDDIFKSFGGRIRPLGDSKGIFPEYIAFNWMREKPLDPSRNPLHRGLQQELAKYGLTFAKVNAMSKKKLLRWVGEESEVANDDDTDTHTGSAVVGAARQFVKPKPEPPGTSMTAKDAEELFESFWRAYPSCSRKVNKKVCHDKFVRILKNSNDGVSIFNQIMSGLKKWIASKDWNKDGGQFICAPLVWLNQERWTADVESDPTRRIVEKKPVVVKADDWALCSERCANCTGCGCKRGVKIPPQMWNHPTTPEECQMFARI